MKSRVPRVLTWHVHGNYLYYLTQTPCHFILPVGLDKHGYSGCSGSFPWGDNIQEVPVEQVPDIKFDCVLFQSRQNYLEDQYEILSDAQRRLPRIYVEHDPPREQPTETVHVVDDHGVLVVHVTHFNELMWNNRGLPTRVIEHGVLIPPGVSYRGATEKGIVVINNIDTRGRRLGLDVFEHVSGTIPLDIVGMGSKDVGGLGEIPQAALPEFISNYRFFFNPIRYTSLGLAVCEAMMVGMPIVGLATTEMAVAVENGKSGFVHTNVDLLIEKMQQLLREPQQARLLGDGARELARKNHSIDRFAADWAHTFHEVISAGAIDAPKRMGSSA